MKKVFITVLTVITLSQIAGAQLKAGLVAGGNFYNQRVNATEGNIYGSERIKSYHAGVVADLELGKGFYLQPKLLFARKGATLLNVQDGQNIKIRMSYAELPVSLVYIQDVSFGKLTVGGGMGYGYLLGGKEEQAGKTTKLFSGDATNWNRNEFSYHFTAGIEFNNGLFLNVSSQKSINDINKTSELNIKNRSMAISVGYLLDWHRKK